MIEDENALLSLFSSRKYMGALSKTLKNWLQDMTVL
jgi:hypothetical protein